MLIREGVLAAPAQIFNRYRGKQLTATVEPDGTVTFNGASYPTLSAAGGMAKRPLYKGRRPEKVPPTNGWAFWHVVDPSTSRPVVIDVLRHRFLQKKADEAKRFGETRG